MHNKNFRTGFMHLYKKLLFFASRVILYLTKQLTFSVFKLSSMIKNNSFLPPRNDLHLLFWLTSFLRTNLIEKSKKQSFLVSVGNAFLWCFLSIWYDIRTEVFFHPDYMFKHKIQHHESSKHGKLFLNCSIYFLYSIDYYFFSKNGKKKCYAKMMIIFIPLFIQSLVILYLTKQLAFFLHLDVK